MTTDNPFEALRTLVERVTEVLAKVAPGLTLADVKFDPATETGRWPHPDLMHVTFLLDPALAFAPEGAPVDPPVDPDEQAAFDRDFENLITMDAKDAKDEAQEQRKQQLRAQLDELRDPDDGIGLD